MTTNVAVPGLLARHVLRREAARWWSAPLVAGIVWYLIAWLVLRANITSLATVGVLVGGAFLIAAATEGGMAGLMAGGWRVAHLALCALFVLGAVWAFVRPIDTFFALASVLGLLLFLEGALFVARSLALREETSLWGITLVSGVLLVLLGFWVSSSDRMWNLAGRAVFILAAVGFYAVFRGTSDVVLAFALRRLGHAQGPDVGSLAGPLPTQERRSPAEPEPARQPRGTAF